MPFFARPDLSDEQFKQLQGSVLTLSGQTRIASLSGLTLIGDSGYIPIIATGGTVGYVMTYNANNQITLQPSTGGGGVYAGASPTTCTVGGLNSGSPILGCSISCILEEILVPTVNPTLTMPSSTFCISPSMSSAEVGSSILVTGCACFNAGCISPQYTATCDKRSCGPLCYLYNTWGTPLPVAAGGYCFNSYSFVAHNVTAGNNTVSSTVCYAQGVQPKNSAGGDYDCFITDGCTTPINTVTICGLFPYYYGRVTCAAAAGVGRPSASCIQTIINSGSGVCNKVVSNSSSTIAINFGSATSDYIWFAIPVCGGVSKTKWCVDALNNGNIGGVVSAGGNLFPAQDVTTVTSTIWTNVSCSPQSYQIYVSNYQTASSTIMYLKNS